MHNTKIKLRFYLDVFQVAGPYSPTYDTNLLWYNLNDLSKNNQIIKA